MEKEQTLKNRTTFHELIKFGIVGSIAVVVQYVVYYLCLNVLSHNIAFTIGYLVSFVVNYLLTTAFTFKTHKSVNNSIGFAICHVINYLLQTGLLNLFYSGISKPIAPLPVFAICVPTNFVLNEEVMDRIVAVFDFDGTLTTKDTLLEFIKFACGKSKFYFGFLLYSPILVLMKLHLYPNWKAKEKIFSYYFKGMSYKKFQELGKSFASVVDGIIRDSVIETLKKHIGEGHDVYVISASIEEWVRPWCERNGGRNVLGTRGEGREKEIITGRFLTNNCYGQEKVNRLLQCEPNRHEYYLYAYGDSRGDKEVLAFADVGTYVYR